MFQNIGATEDDGMRSVRSRAKRGRICGGEHLAAFEVPHALPVGDDLVEEGLLGVRVVQVVVDDLVAERTARHRPDLEREDGFAHRRREALGVRLVRVPLERGWRRELVLDPVKAGGDDRGEGEVRVDVATGNPCLDPSCLPVPDDPEPARAVVVSPGERRWRPAARRIALVRVDRRRKEDGELLEARRSTRKIGRAHV